MAKKIKPKQGGYDAQKERQERAKQTYRITVKDGDLSFTYQPYGIPMRIRGYVRDATGMSVDDLLYKRGTVDVQTYADIWWITRLCGGEVNEETMRPVSRGDVFDEFDARFPGATLSDIDDRLIEDDVENSPEA